MLRYEWLNNIIGDLLSFYVESLFVGEKFVAKLYLFMIENMVYILFWFFSVTLFAAFTVRLQVVLWKSFHFSQINLEFLRFSHFPSLSVANFGFTQ